jgi:PleD family two-component response regulator
MNKDRLLVVEDDFEISDMLRVYLGAKGYDVTITPRGEEALELCHQRLPHAILLDVRLPDVDGHTVLRRLRGNLRTSQVPVLFLTVMVERHDRIAGLELGADDYMTKPFDLEELRLRVRRSIRRARMVNLNNPITGLPGGKQIEAQLHDLMRRDDWALLYARVNHMGPFRDKRGPWAGDQVLRDVVQVLNEAVGEFGTPNDYVGHPDFDDFVVITSAEQGPVIRDRIVAHFNQDVNGYYSSAERENKCITVGGRRYPLMSLSAGVISPQDGPFENIEAISRTAARSRLAARKKP